ncbi:hypothetical protein EG832_22285 [bacterium]|nr:hypothetical protein [bacterium]
MSKIDEVKQQIKDVYYKEWNCLPKYENVIEELRPYVEFTETVSELNAHLDTKKIFEAIKKFQELTNAD